MQVNVQNLVDIAWCSICLRHSKYATSPGVSVSQVPFLGKQKCEVRGGSSRENLGDVASGNKGEKGVWGEASRKIFDHLLLNKLIFEVLAIRT